MANFKDVLKYLEQDLQVSHNYQPPLLVEGGAMYPVNFEGRFKENKQVIMIVHEIQRGDEISRRNIEHYTKEALRLKDSIGSFTFESRAEVEDVLQQLAKY